jgi:imidazolonepropionase-like amidohydrolase
VKSAGDPLDAILKVRALVNSGERLGAELFICGPMFTAPGRHSVAYFKNQTVQIPKTPDEARQQVQALKQHGVDGISVILEPGQDGNLFKGMDVAILRALAEEARALKLPIVIHTGDARDVQDALSVGANEVEDGSVREKLPDALFAQMQARGVAYDPSLTAMEGFASVIDSSLDPLDRPLVLQAGPAALIDSTKKFLQSENGAQIRAQLKVYPISLDLGKENLAAAWKAGVLLVAGSDAGNPLTLHGPTIQREVELWVEAGIPPAVALQAATYNAARLLGVSDRIGLIREGHDANLLLVDGNPLKEIKQLESIQSVIFRGERISRSELFDQE